MFMEISFAGERLRRRHSLRPGRAAILPAPLSLSALKRVALLESHDSMTGGRCGDPKRWR
jgi:hypothetical protein